MNISTVNELIQSLESAGELSIKERKYLELAREFKRLAAENVALKEDRDTLARYWIEDGGDEDCAMSYCEPTPATDRIVAGIKAEGVEQYAALFADTVNMEREHNQQFHKGTLWFAKQLREGGDK
ncbi:hypothetical protein [Klebsiella pneumoniae]|uniref:hypothetical protein n=1 Tax=Klebsiella pneumoniae TaxID=573 RepID=UPI001D0DFBCA|nr:hypothetical protein [Klebsiella pneumoniae]